MAKSLKREIDLTDKKNFNKNEKAIASMISKNVQDYFQSPCSVKLRKRCAALDKSNDLDFSTGSEAGNPGTFVTQLGFPVVKSKTLTRTAMFDQDGDFDPPVTVGKTAGTTSENAKNVQKLVVHNMRATKWRATTLREIKRDSGSYGASVVVSYYDQSVEMADDIVEGPFGLERKEVEISRTEVCRNDAIDPRNYFQDPDEPNHKKSHIKGYVEKTNAANIYEDYVNSQDVYIKKNLKRLLTDSRNGSVESEDYFQKNSDIGTRDTLHNNDIYLYKMYHKCKIKGNETNNKYYYIEYAECGEERSIIRFQGNPYVKNLVPITPITFFPRRDYWWGNTDAEFVLGHERFINIIMSMKADAAIRSQDQTTFYKSGSIDPQDWNNRGRNGNRVAVDTGDSRIGDVITQWQPQDQSLQTTDSIMKFVQQNIQELSTNPDFSRAASAGGFQNTTATAASVMAAQADVIENMIRRDFSFGLAEVYEIDVIILQQFLGPRFGISPDAQSDDIELEKYQILGNFIYQVDTSFTKNNVTQLTNLQNILTGIQNFQGTQDPEWMALQKRAIIRKWIEMADVGDVDGILPQQPQGQPAIQQPGAIPQQVGPPQVATPQQPLPQELAGV